MGEIKLTDPRFLDSDDLLPYKEDPALLEPSNNKIRFTEYRGVQAQRTADKP